MAANRGRTTWTSAAPEPDHDPTIERRLLLASRQAMTTSGQGRRPVSRAARSALIATARNVARASDSEPVAPARRAASFESLPGYDEIHILTMLGRQLGIAVPFYRTHEMRAGVETEFAGRRLTNFTSYDYLSINGHPEITTAVAEAAARWGTSVSASRLTSGERPFHAELEGELAQLYAAEDALVFVSGHATNLAAISTVVGPDDLIVHDALAHNSIVLGAEMSGAHRRSFAHNDCAALDALLASTRSQYRNCLVVTEGLFSMDGDGPDLARLIEIKARHGAWLMVDEAHSLGVLGKTGRGLAEHARVDPSEVDIWMGTLSKSLVSCGGYIAAPRALTTYLRYRAPGMVYSVGIAPPAAVAAKTALDILLREPQRVARLADNGRAFCDGARAAGLDVGGSWGAAITPVIIGDSLQTVMLAERLASEGIAAVPVIPPGVPERSARLRFFISAGHDAQAIERAVRLTAEGLASLRALNVSLADLQAKGLKPELFNRPE
jgi:8-amino-7-oxononanoate synthase